VEPVAGIAPPLGQPATPVSVWRLRTGTVAAGLVALAFSQRPGLIVGDTKADLVLDPGGFLSRALTAWDPQQAFGQLQNQAYGYLWPVGPFFWLGHALGVPAWVVQRSWWALLLVVAFLGCVRLAGALGIGSPATRLVAGVAYALSPRVLSVLGAISVEALPLAVLPWVLLPLVGSGRSDRKAAALSGVAVLCIGGVNAAATLAVLPLPALYLVLTRRRRLLGWWAGAVVLATAWWLLPLLVLGRYAYPFLDEIENAGITTQVTTVTNALRGTGQWLAYLVVHGAPRWPAGFEIATSALPVLGTAVVAGIGLAGLTRLRSHRWLLVSVLLGTAVLAVGHAGTLTSPVAGEVRQLLDGPLNAFRNVHKFDPLIRLPLALGLAHALTLRPSLPRLPRLAPAVAAAVGLGLVATAAPVWGGTLAPEHGYAALPGYWRDTAAWLDQHAGPARGRALLEPAANFGDYQWGSPTDEPLQALARSPWAVRDSVPLGAPGATRLLDAVEARLATGQPSPVLAAVLARAGVRYVVLRNDIDPDRAGSERPAVVRAALAGSPGLSLAAAFGPRQRAGLDADDSAVPGPPGSPAVEIFAVDAPDGPADAAFYPRAGAVAMSGGPEGVFALADAGLLAGRAVIATPDLPGPGAVDAVAVTDTYRRRSINFGADPGSRYSPVLPASVDPGAGRPAADLEPYGAPDVAEQSTEVLAGAAAVRASSSAADPFAATYLGPQRRPESAFDGDPGTSWVSDSASGPLGQWVEVSLERPVTAGSIAVTMLADPSIGPAVTWLRLDTDAGERTVPVLPGKRPQQVPLPPGPTARVRITIDRVDGADAGAAGIREVAIPGAPAVTPGVAVPTDAAPLLAAGLPWTVLTAREPGRRGDCVDTSTAGPDPGTWTCVVGMATAGEETGPLDRRFTTGRAAAVSVRVSATPRQGPALNAVLDRAYGYRATGSSALSADPSARPGAAYDGDPATAWLPATDDPAPQLRLDLGSTVTLSGLRLGGAARDYAGLAGVVLAGGGQRRELRAAAGTQRFAPLRAREVTLTVRRVAGADGGLRPVRLAEVGLVGAPARAAGMVSVDCGGGPVLGLDGARIETAVTAPAAALLTLAPVPARGCAGPVGLAAGGHRLTTAPAAGTPFEAYAAALSGDRPLPAAGPARAVRVDSRSAEHRVLAVAAGAAGYVALAEGYNAGWRATAGGTPLTPVRLDGWRQGWILPAGGATRIEVRFTPGRWHRAGLLGGLVVALLLLVLAFAPDWGGQGRAPGEFERWRVAATAVVIGLPILLIGPAGVAPAGLAFLVPPRWRAATAAGLLAAAGLALGFAPGAGVAPALAQLAAVSSLVLAAAALHPQPLPAAGARPPGSGAPPAPTTAPPPPPTPAP
jgi:arabinofuranan 3-O-arabinosyltransferase